jgi:methanogenic corrinoid protein MtbC1
MQKKERKQYENFSGEKTLKRILMQWRFSWRQSEEENLSEKRRRLTEAIAKYDQEAVQMVKERLETGEDPLRILEDMGKGMDIVGEKYGKGITSSQRL